MIILRITRALRRSIVRRLRNGESSGSERRQAHEQQRRDQRGLSAQSVAVVSEDGGTDRTHHETYGVNRKDLQRAGTLSIRHCVRRKGRYDAVTSQTCNAQ